MRTADLPQGTNGSEAPTAGWLRSCVACLADPLPQYILVGAVLLLIILLQVCILAEGSPHNLQLSGCNQAHALLYSSKCSLSIDRPMQLSSTCKAGRNLAA